MKSLPGALALCLLPSLAAAQGETIGTYFDAAATRTSTVVAPFEQFDIYFIAQNLPHDVAGYEFEVSMPPELVILQVTAHPVAFNTLDIDPSNEGFIVGIGGPCLQGPGPVVLAEFRCMALQTASALPITIGPSNPSSFGGTAPGYAACNSLTLHPFADAYAGPARVDVVDPASCTWYCGSGTNALTDGFVVGSPPVLGGSFTASVTGCDAASAGAFLVAYGSSLGLPTTWGEVLVNFADPGGELLGMPLAVGNPAGFDLPIPSAPGLAGLTVFTQAGSFGGTICLHCAHQCRVGP